MTTNKIEQALIAYATARAACDAKTKEIRTALESCARSQDEHLKAAYGPEAVILRGYVDHLKMAYSMLRDKEIGGRYYEYHEGDVEAYLELEAACPHCLAAHRAIQERKTLRQALGQAKRRITCLANSLAKDSKD